MSERVDPMVNRVLEAEREQRNAMALAQLLGSVPSALTPVPVTRFRLNFAGDGLFVLVCAREGAVMADGTLQPRAVGAVAALELTLEAAEELAQLLMNGVAQGKSMATEKRGPIGLVSED